MQQKNLRSEIQALKNQAEAHTNTIRAAVEREGYVSTYIHVYHDLLWTLLFLFIAIIILFFASIEISSLGLFLTIRESLHIAAVTL